MFLVGGAILLYIGVHEYAYGRLSVVSPAEKSYKHTHPP